MRYFDSDCSCKMWADDCFQSCFCDMQSFLFEIFTLRHFIKMFRSRKTVRIAWRTFVWFTMLGCRCCCCSRLNVFKVNSALGNTTDNHTTSKLSCLLPVEIPWKHETASNESWGNSLNKRSKHNQQQIKKESEKKQDALDKRLDNVSVWRSSLLALSGQILITSDLLFPKCW